MAPIKFEENIKDKLEKRSLSPSSDGWSKLSDRLDAEEKTSKNSIFWWLSIAAGIIIMIAISTQFFRGNQSTEATPQIVQDKVKEQQIEAEAQKLNATESIELASEEDNVDSEKNNSLITKEPQIIDYKKVINKKQKAQTKLAEQNNISVKNDGLKQDNLISEKANELLNKVEMKEAVAKAITKIKTENTTVTDREIDSLLKVASKELFKDKLQKETSKTVDANALLMSVEDDMGQSFRSKVFDALKDSYKTVKTAVADRNN
ncbi:hypothetical protein FBALC1_14367 [Flavobacteriales bacterium ALC-1]|nr:hypothetical protein FBALC1_14367 [Flavobacteriales bacterium ALC-1]